MQEIKQSVLTIEQPGKLTMSGVTSVDNFGPTSIVLTVQGKRVTIAGAGLKVLSFSEGSGNFSASGEVRSVRYGAKNALGKLFRA